MKSVALFMLHFFGRPSTRPCQPFPNKGSYFSCHTILSTISENKDVKFMPVNWTAKPSKQYIHRNFAQKRVTKKCDPQ